MRKIRSILLALGGLAALTVAASCRPSRLGSRGHPAERPDPPGDPGVLHLRGTSVALDYVLDAKRTIRPRVV